MLNQRGITSGDLGKRLQLHKSTVSRLVAQLVERGWVERRPCKGDGRVLALHLKPEGVRVAVQVTLARGGKPEMVVNALREEELPTVLRSLADLVDSIEENHVDKTLVE
jgi:DNA-binding MarR family transcriptional regulator